MIRALDIAGMVCPNNVFLAPMAGYTNYPFRKMCSLLGAGLTFTEMVSAKGLHYGNEETKLLLYHGDPTPPLAATRHSERSEESRGTESECSARSFDKLRMTPSASAEQSAPPAATRHSERSEESPQTESECSARSFDKLRMTPSASAEQSAPLDATRHSERSEESPQTESVRPSSPIAAQIFGSDPDIMREACESEHLSDFDLIDINMGCPMPKIVRNGDGSALMENFPLAEKVIAACAKSGKRISVKFRTGVDEAHKCAAEFAKLCEGAGACMITVHGRTRDKIYAGPADYDEIAAAKAAVGIPVIANGGIWNSKDVKKMLDRTGADGVMIARAALYRPTVFCSVAEEEEPPLLPLFLGQLDETKELYGEHFACVFMRKMAAFYLKGRHGASEAKRRFFSAQTTEEIKTIAKEIMG